VKLIRYIPFLYFQQTRINTFKAAAFHGLYEWVPAIAIVLVVDQSAIQYVLLYYLAFISLYEIGYLFNDLLANQQENGRTRSTKSSLIEAIIFILIRLGFFFAATIVARKVSSADWWIWYATLVLLFAGHNMLANRLLKVVTFSALAFIRFFSPIVNILPTELFLVLSVPIGVNYVLYRMIIYMDSKGMLTNIERKSIYFRIMFYLLSFAFSLIVYAKTFSWWPMLVSAYFLNINLFSVFLERTDQVAKLLKK
jgi:hypothetical protein